MKSVQRCRAFLAGHKREGHAREEGYSLVELLVVLAIIVLLGTIAVPQLLKYLDRAKRVHGAGGRSNRFPQPSIS